MTKRAASKKKERWIEQAVRSIRLEPLNQRQKEYMNSIRHYATVVGLGFAGTGKTYISATIACEMLVSGQIDKIIIARPLVSVGTSAGLLPGTLDEKLEPWFRPITDVLRKHLGEGRYETSRKNNIIEFAAFEQMQGRSFEDTFIILTEAQNCSEFELKMFLTRLGDNCKAVVEGDIRQCSLKEGSGLLRVIEMIDTYQLPVPITQFEMQDIVRSDQCLMWIAGFEALSTNAADIHPYARSKFEKYVRSSNGSLAPARNRR